MKVIKKNGELESWSRKKIEKALLLASSRAQKNPITEEQIELVCYKLENNLKDVKEIKTVDLHDHVLAALFDVNHEVFVQYKAYREYKKKFSRSFTNAYEFSKKVVLSGDKENANKDSSLNSTKQSLIASGTMKEFMNSFEMKPEWIEAHNEGMIHIHDLAERYLCSHNCNLFDMANVLRGGFELNGVKYKEPNGVQSALNVASDVVLSASAQQYGGFTVCEVDSIFAPYAEKTYKNAFEYFSQFVEEEKAKELAYNQTVREIEQGYQAFETKLNTVSNSLGQTPFVTISLGMETSEWGRKVTEIILKIRKEGLGATHVTAIFPKLVFLHRNEINGEPGTPNYDLKQQAIDCSTTRLYPDFLSIDKGVLAEIYEESGLIVSPMGCRAFLGRFIHPETNEMVITGRANIGAVTLNVPMYALDAKGDVDKFYEIVDKYIDMVFMIHLDAYERIGKSKGATNPLFYCEGGAWKTVGYEDEIAPVVEGFTASLGYIGLEEACWALFGSSLEDNIEWATSFVQYLWDKTMEYKAKYNKLFTLYATPAESLIGRFMKFNKEKHGEIKGATDRSYLTNSFHQHVSKKFFPPEKMLLEDPMFQITQGGRIQYCEYPYGVDKKALEQAISFGMKLGHYSGVNIESATCNDCGTQGEFVNCPECGSNNITEVSRCCGYLSFSKVKGNTRYNEAKKDEINERVLHLSQDRDRHKRSEV